MASPQTKNGYTRIANEILEKIAKTDLNGTQLRIVMVIWRYTYGFSRKDHEISLAFLAEALDTMRGHVDRELTNLINRKIINIVGTGKRRGRILSFNKNYEEWSDRPLNQTEEPAPPPKKSTKSKKEKKAKYDESSSYYRMALYFHKKVKVVAKEAGVEHLIAKVNLQTWADDFRKLVELDKVDKRLAKEVMDWVTQDSFWKTNVLSAKKLREKFTDLAIKMKAQSSPKQPTQPHRDIRDKEIEFQRWVQEGNNPDEFNWRN